MPKPTSEVPPGVYFHTHIADPKKRIEAYIQEYSDTHPSLDEGKAPSFDTIIMRDNLRCQAAMLDASSKRCSVTFSLDVRPELCSRTGNLHGGAAALVFDMCTGMAVAPLATVEGWRFGGVSRNLNVSYLRPVPVGTVVDVVCEVVSLGKSLATITGKMQTTEGKLLAMAQHDKAWVDIVARSNKM